LLKRVSDRTRPDGSNNRSFPSDHASASGAFTTLARRNLESLSLSPGGRIFANIGIAGMAAGTAWARVEAKKHYLSDVLAGYALGHFLSAFINDAFLGLDKEKAPQLTIEPSRKGMMMGISWAY
jgi:membrane-associated phospholipid phosphatase